MDVDSASEMDRNLPWYTRYTILQHFLLRVGWKNIDQNHCMISSRKPISPLQVTYTHHCQLLNSLSRSIYKRKSIAPFIVLWASRNR